jgi:hypothetical protein
MIEVIFCALGVYVLTLVISSYSGPLGLFSRFRNCLPKPLNDLVTCFTCLSFYVAIPFCLFNGLDLLQYFAVVGLAVVVNEATC